MIISPERRSAMYNPGQYVHRASPVHRLDPRVKIIAVTSLSIIILQVSPVGLAAVAAAAAAAALLAGISLRLLFGGLRPFLPFFFCLLGVYILFTPGSQLLLAAGPVQISREGLYLGIFQTVRFILLVITAFLLTMTTPPAEIITGLERLSRPLGIIGISSSDLAMMMSLALRFVPTLAGEMKNISDAQLARGASFNPNRITGKIRAISRLAWPLAINIFRRCDELADAMEARGYRPGPRTCLRELVLTPAEYGLIGVLIAAVIAVFV